MAGAGTADEAAGDAATGADTGVDAVGWAEGVDAVGWACVLEGAWGLVVGTALVPEVDVEPAENRALKKAMIALARCSKPAASALMISPPVPAAGGWVAGAWGAAWTGAAVLAVGAETEGAGTGAGAWEASVVVPVGPPARRSEGWTRVEIHGVWATWLATARSFRFKRWR